MLVTFEIIGIYWSKANKVISPYLALVHIEDQE